MEAVDVHSGLPRGSSAAGHSHASAHRGAVGAGLAEARRPSALAVTPLRHGVVAVRASVPPASAAAHSVMRRASATGVAARAGPAAQAVLAVMPSMGRSGAYAGTHAVQGGHPTRIGLGCCVADVNGDALDDMILPTKALRYLRIQKSDEGEGAEGLGDEHVGHFAELCEVLAQVVRRHVLSAAADEDLARHLLDLALLLEKLERPYRLSTRLCLITLELGILTSHHRPSIMCLWARTRICDS